MDLKHIAFTFFSQFLFVLSVYPAYANPLTDNLHLDPEWLRLVHYEKSWFGNYKSQGRTSAFFLNSDGYTDPKAEITSLYKELTNIPTTEDMTTRDIHGRCRFPARSQWLAKKLDLKIPGDSWCGEFFSWKNRIRAQSVTIVFSSYYLNSPSSTYGHTLLRLNRHHLNEKRKDSEGQQLLDFGFNYGANPTSDNPILYAISGITGLMPGTFLALPYFYKVREYNDYEVRDLWEYDLKFTTEEVDRLVDHFWEVAHTQFGYVYVTQNCGYHILNLLDVAAPQHNLMNQLRYWVVPGDTIRILERSDLIERVQFRPSVRRQFLTREAKLTNEEQKILWKLNQDYQKTELLDAYSPERKAHIIDAAIDLMDLQHSQNLIDEKAPIRKIKNSYLTLRSRLPITQPLEILTPHEEEPHTAHPSGRIGLGSSWRDYQNINSNNEGNNYYHLSYRAALHDLVDPLKGYLKHSRTEMGSLNLRYDPEKENLSLDKATILALDSLGPLSRFNDKSTWRLSAGLARRTDMFCQDCVRSEFFFGMGYALATEKIVNTYGLVTARFSYADGFVGNELAAHLGPLLGINAHLNEKLGLQLEWGWNYNWHEHQERGMSEGTATARYFVNTVWALDVAASKNPYEKNATATLFYYY